MPSSQLKGTLHDKLGSYVRQELVNLVSHFYAVVDFPDEGVDPFLISEANKVLDDCTETNRMSAIKRTIVDVS